MDDGSKQFNRILAVGVKVMCRLAIGLEGADSGVSSYITRFNNILPSKEHLRWQ